VALWVREWRRDRAGAGWAEAELGPETGEQEIHHEAEPWVTTTGETMAADALTTSLMAPASGAVPDAENTTGPAAAPARLTPKQRRRAVHKANRRLPADLPGGVAPAPAAGDHQLPGPAETTRATLTPFVRDRAGEHHDARHERLPDPRMVWDPRRQALMPVFPTLLESVSWEAHFRQWEADAEDDIWALRELVAGFDAIEIPRLVAA
jgi:hypothetical protein